MSIAAPKNKWRIAPENRAAAQELSRALAIPRLIAHLLMLRGIASKNEADLFLRPDIGELADPFLLPDMAKAVERVKRAAERKEKIRIFGDYDVDGISGTVLLMSALRRAGIDSCDCALPNRSGEGYGINPSHLKAAHEAGVTLIITVDNGIAARDAAETAKSLGIDLIVTDHHPPEGTPPDAFAIVNPKCEDSRYPDYDASGAAVAFHLDRAYTGRMEDLDLVALGTIADVVPLQGENRILAAAGLEHMAKGGRVGLAALASVADIDIREITSEQVAFQLGPRINAAGRIGDGTLPLRLLLTESREEAAMLAKELNAANVRRREIEKLIYEDAVRQIETRCCSDQRSIVLASREWHAGVVGIVAARLQNMYNRPVVLVAVGEDGIGRGSARSPEMFDMAAALGGCKDFLLRYGGHAAAAGLAIVEQYIEKFRSKFEEEAQRRLADVEAESKLSIDALVSLSEIDERLVKTLDLLEPYGCMNPTPVFCSCGVAIAPQSIRELRGSHLRLTVRQGPKMLNAIGFRMAHRIPEIRNASQIDIAFSPRFNTWRGETSIQLLLKDLRPTS